MYSDAVHRRLQCVCPRPRFSQMAGQVAVVATNQHFDDPDAACVQEQCKLRGEGLYEPADWENLVKYYAAVGKDKFCQDLKLQVSTEHNEKLVFVTKDKNLFYQLNRRQPPSCYAFSVLP